MSKIEIINYDLHKIYQFVRENLYDCKCPFTEVKDAKYHHNRSYKSTPNVIKNGILSFQKNMIINYGRDLTFEEKRHLYDDYHVNGIDQISLSSPDINMEDVRDDEWIYNSKQFYLVDILISSSVETIRNRTNYANEFLAQDEISNDKFKAIDTRLLSHQYRLNEANIQSLVDNYNYLREIAVALKNSNLDIPLRERGLEDFNLDVEKVKALPELRVK